MTVYFWRLLLQLNLTDNYFFLFFVILCLALALFYVVFFVNFYIFCYIRFVFGIIMYSMLLWC